MTLTLFFTILIEGVIVLGVARWRKKPVGRLLLASLLGNLLTQMLLWWVLTLLPTPYLATLFVAEVFIWLIEIFVLYYFPGTRLAWNEAFWLSLGMNLASFAIGLFLPI